LPWQGCKIAEAVYESIQEALFADSGHADETAEAFRHWDEESPPEVPVSCAKCHSLGGFIDFAADGVVDGPAQPAVFDCDLCHTNPETGATRSFVSVTFPSGAVIETTGPEAICMQCHQGRASTATVDSAIALAGVGDDTSTASLRFSNIHYFAAAATMYGTLVKGGYQYAGKTYDGKFSHVDGYTGCQDCHNPHSLEIKTENCDTCHTNVKSAADLHNIRYLGSLTDYDGDGNISEGIFYEVEGVLAKLYSGILAYGANVVGVPIAYDESSYPYFFIDPNNNGVVDPSETTGYNAFSPRLLRACYNFQVVKKDPGGFAHGGKYLIELMYDSLEDLNSAMGSAVSMAGMHRTDEGHFDGSSEAWRHWDADGEVPSRCARCHSATGLAEFLETGENAEAAHIANGMLCTTCHTTPPTVRAAGAIEFPSGAVVDLGDSSNLCLSCHQGRAAKSSVDRTIGSSAGPYGFTNIHYFPAAATFFGNEVHGGYEYPGKVYAGRNPFPNHLGKFDTCVKCHMGTMGVDPNKGHNVHSPNPADCVGCHGQDISQPYPGADPAKFKFSGIRPGNMPDFDADGNVSESLKAEIQGLEAALYAQIQAYGFAIGSPIVYDSHSYPYFFEDTNGNGIKDSSETSGYQFNAKMLKAAYNYQMSQKEPCGYIHNPTYVAQLLVDSIQNLGGNISPYTWR
jgi:hypothetical protein